MLPIGVSLQLGRERVRTQNRPYAVAAGPSALLTASTLPIDRAEPSRSARGREGHTYLQVWGASDCVVTDWAPWSPCSVSCGAGERMRLREASECRRC
jgi:hypothetical protein